MKTLRNKFTVIFVILFCGSGVLLSREASAEVRNGTNNEKYADIIPKGIDPMDTFAYSLLIEHLKRPPSRISTDGKPIEHGYYVIDTHRKADGSPIHFETNHFSEGLTDQVLPPLQSSKSEYSGGGGVASIYQQSTDQHVASSFQEEIKLSSGNTRDLSNISLTTTTEPPLPHLAQDVHPPNVNSTSEYQQTHNQQPTHDHGSKISPKTPTSEPVDAHNPLESSYQKHPNFPQLHTLSEQLKFLSESLKQLQLLSRPGGGGSPEKQEPHLSESQSIINQQDTTSQEPPNHQQQQVTPSHVSNSDLDVSSTVSTIGYQISQSSEAQMQLPEDLGTHIMTLHKTNVPSTDSPLPSPQSSPGPTELEHGIPTNLNEEMDLLEASLRNQQYSQSQTPPGTTPNVQEATRDTFSSHQQQNYHNPHLKPTVVDKVITNGLISAHNLPVKYHHSVSHKIPGQQLPQQVPANNQPGFVSNNAQPYYDHSQYDNNSPVIFKNKHFSMQGSPLAQSHYFKTGTHHQEQTNYEGNSHQQEQQTPITTNKYLQHDNILSRPPLQINSHGHFPIFSRDNTIQKAVEILNNYSDAFLENIVLTEQQHQHKKIKQQPTPNNFHHVPVVTSPSTTPVTTRSPIQNSHIKIQPFAESGVDYSQTISPTTTVPLIRQPSPTPQQINIQQQRIFEQYSPKNVQTHSQFSEQSTSPYSEKIQFKPAYARVILRNGQQQHGLSSQLSENIESSSSIANKYMFPNSPNSPPSPPNRPPLHHYPSDGKIIKSNSVLKPQFSAPDMLFQSTQQIEQVLKSAVLPTPKASSQSSVKYSTIFIRPQVEGSSSSSESWKTASSEVQSRIPSTKAKPLNYEGFQSFGKIF